MNNENETVEDLCSGFVKFCESCSIEYVEIDNRDKNEPNKYHIINPFDCELPPSVSVLMKPTTFDELIAKKYKGKVNVN